MNNKGLFITFEGIDGSGKGTQLMLLAEHIKKLDKYQDIVITHEPWKSKKIKDRLEKVRDAFSSGLEIANLFIEDRVKHTKELIIPNIRKGIFVLSDRYALSTIAYQSAQGISSEVLLNMHHGKGILIPDITFFIDLTSKIAEQRLRKRGNPIDKFEEEKFRKILIEQYRKLIKDAQKNEQCFGKVVIIDGTKNISKVAESIKKEFGKVYEKWRSA